MYTAQGEMLCQPQQSGSDVVEHFGELNADKKMLFAQGLVAASRTDCKGITSSTLTPNSKCYRAIKNQYNNVGCDSKAFARCDWPAGNRPRATDCAAGFDENQRATYYHDVISKVNNYVTNHSDTRIQSALKNLASREGKDFGTYDREWRNNTSSFAGDLRSMYEKDLLPQLQLDTKCPAP